MLTCAQQDGDAEIGEWSARARTASLTAKFAADHQHPACADIEILTSYITEGLENGIGPGEPLGCRG